MPCKRTRTPLFQIPAPKSSPEPAQRSTQRPNAPAANKSESPGKNGVTTKPVSQKMTKNKTTYSHGPIVVASWLRLSSRCRNQLRISTFDHIGRVGLRIFRAFYLNHSRRDQTCPRNREKYNIGKNGPPEGCNDLQPAKTIVTIHLYTG